MARVVSRRSVICGLLLGMIGLALAPIPEAVAGENYALLVAVGDYDLKELRPLKFTRADILDFQKALVESGFPAKNVVLMHDDLPKLVAHYEKLGADYKAKDYLPESAKVRRELELMLGKLRPDDSVVVAFSGHGVQFKGENKSYFCPADAKLEQKNSLIAFEEVFAALNDSAAGRKLLLVDACQNDPQSGISKSRKTVDLDSVTRPQTEALPEGIVALFSCRAGQQSFELPELGHGVFFYHLLEGWKGNADANGDRKLTYQELAAYTEKKTADFAALKLKALQTPQLRSDFSGEWVLRNLRSNDIITNSIGMKLARIEAGEYLRGTPDAEIDSILRSDPKAKRQWFDDERPQHAVRISTVFYFGVYEVTQVEWKSVMKTEPWKGKSDVREGDDYPATYVSWDDAQQFCRKLSQRDNRPYRLPTEAEWEYACRGGTTTQFSFGDDSSQATEHGWIDKNSLNIGEKYAHQVGLKKSNPFGLFDMHGNVCEWCQDWHDVNEYARHAGRTSTDPQGPQRATWRVSRGGNWSESALATRSARRIVDAPTDRGSVLGFRVVAGEPPKSQLPAGMKAGEKWDRNGLKMTFCWCPDGTFVMGSPKREKDRGPDEESVQVTLTGFWMGMHEVTQHEWTSVMGTTFKEQAEKGTYSKTVHGEGPRHPMYFVNHDEATEFARKLTQQEHGAGSLPEGWEYRLPTEAQWEYACRAGTTTHFASGDEESSLGQYAWLSTNAASETHPVGQKRANPWGLCDMQGNVWEWCRDWYESRLPGGRDPEVSANASSRVLRGGSWFKSRWGWRVADRSRNFPNDRHDYLGFRLALVRVAR